MERRKTLFITKPSRRGPHQSHFDPRPFSVFRHIRQSSGISACFEKSIVELSKKKTYVSPGGTTEGQQLESHSQI